MFSFYNDSPESNRAPVRESFFVRFGVNLHSDAISTQVRLRCEPKWDKKHAIASAHSADVSFSYPILLVSLSVFVFVFLLADALTNYNLDCTIACVCVRGLPLEDKLWFNVLWLGSFISAKYIPNLSIPLPHPYLYSSLCVSLSLATPTSQPKKMTNKQTVYRKRPDVRQQLSMCKSFHILYHNLLFVWALQISSFRCPMCCMDRIHKNTSHHLEIVP